MTKRKQIKELAIGIQWALISSINHQLSYDLWAQVETDMRFQINANPHIWMWIRD
jgi:hypothetical protein